MKTNVKVPLFLNKILNIYSTITITIGIVVIAVINISHLKPSTKAYPACGGNCPSFAPVCDGDFYSPGGTRYGSICVDNASKSCPSASPVDCSNPAVCNDSMKNYLNPGQTVFCVPAGDRCGGGSMGYCSVGNANDCWVGTPGQNYRECGCDMNICQSKCEAELSQQLSEITSWQYYDICSECRQLFMCDCSREPVQKKCYYHENPVTIRMSESDNDNLLVNLSENSDLAVSVSYDSFYIKGTASDNAYPLGQYILGTEDDAVLTITGPEGYFQSENCNSSGSSDASNDCKIGSISTSTLTAGIYMVNLIVNEHYNDPDCIKTGYFKIKDTTEPPVERNFVIEKKVNGRRDYQIGEIVTFDIIIWNTGKVVIDHMLYIDRYDTEYLKIIDISGERVKGVEILSNADLSNAIKLHDGELRIDDLVLYLGNLGIDEKFILTIKFKAKKVSQEIKTWNYAIADWEGIYKEDKDWVKIAPLPSPPPTDR